MFHSTWTTVDDVMKARPPQSGDPTTEEHRPPVLSDLPSGRPTLLAAFPTLAALPLPPPGTTVGRAWLASAGIEDREVSGQHLRFSRSGSQLLVEDLGSRNGTFIGGTRIAPREALELEDGAILRMGRTLLVFRESFAGQLAPAPRLAALEGPFGLQGPREALARLSARPVPNVLVVGETGTGKELFVHAVVDALGRRGKPYAAFNVAGVAATVFEAQLFGWKKGAFSGSAEGSDGILKTHKGGTVFLDELGELPSELQPKMLRLLENREILPVGASRPESVDLAIVAATNRDLDAMVESSSFRRDLLARFLARIELPPLRERPEDLFAILRALWQRRGAPLDERGAEVEAVERLMLETWPANVRDLDLFLACLAPNEGLTLAVVRRVLGPRAESSRKRPLSRELVNQVLASCGQNQSEAARRLGVDRAKLLRFLRKIAAE
jgi:transcriptional regulator of acetoin/glycerol metabolism